MCPPPSEPIRPVGPLSGDVYVERARFADRVERRRRREDEQDDERRRGDQPASEEQSEGRDRWFGSDSPLKAAGGYDDHGRTERADAATAAKLPHVDTTA